MGTGPNGEEKSRLLMVNSSSTTGIGGYCYPNPHDDDTSSSNIQNNINFVSHQFDPNPTEMYNLTSGMEMVGFSSKNNNNTSSSVLWREFFNKPHDDHAHSSYQQLDLCVSDPTTTTATASWNINPHQNRLLLDDHESLRSSLTFPCQGNERPSQGLSLSLSSSNPSTIGIQSFELIPHHHHDDHLRFGPSSSRSVVDNIHQHDFQIRNSKYLGPAQDLLSEFCNLGNHNDDTMKTKGSRRVDQVLQDDGNAIKSQSLYSLDLLELQRRKTKLLHMLEQVDRRYKHYCDQMRSVVSSFEALAGNGAARVYSALASKAMSRHFRCVKDGIMSQIKATKKAMGEKDTAAPGASKGETPRLRLLDQTLRQQRVFQQMTMMESHPWRPQRGLPERSVSVLRAWLFEHFLHPYPSDVDKHILARQTGLSRSQVSNWFINARVRLWKPMVEEMYLEELKDRDNNEDDDNDIIINNLTSLSTNEDQKPSHDELMMMRMESDQCLSSIVHHEKSKKSKGVVVAVDHHHNGFGAYGGMEMDFASFGYGSTGANNYCGGSGSGSGSGSGVGVGGGVSLTLGLQHDQQGGSSSIFDQMEDQCQTVQYSLLDSDQSQTLPYRNLMGAQLLHDLAG